MKRKHYYYSTVINNHITFSVKMATSCGDTARDLFLSVKGECLSSVTTYVITGSSIYSKSIVNVPSTIEEYFGEELEYKGRKQIDKSIPSFVEWLLEIVKTEQLVMVEIDINDYQCPHLFILQYIDKKVTITDSYVGCREANSRPFDTILFQKLLTDGRGEDINKLFLLDEYMVTEIVGRVQLTIVI